MNRRNAGEQCKQTAMIDYHIQPWGPGGVPSDLVCKEDASPRPAVEQPTIIEEDYDCVIERAPSLVIKLRDSPLRASKQGNLRIVTQLV